MSFTGLNSGGFVNNSTETFLFLVKNDRAEASRVLVRPALEVTFRLQAIQTKPETLLRVAAWEYEERKKLLNGVAPDLVAETAKRMAANWKATVEHYEKLFPGLPVNETPLSAFDAAKEIPFDPVLKAGKGNENPFYDTYYRFYSPFSHGHIDSLSGEMNYLPFLDNSIMGYCAIIALHATVELGADETMILCDPIYGDVAGVKVFERAGGRTGGGEKWVVALCNNCLISSFIINLALPVTR